LPPPYLCIVGGGAPPGTAVVWGATLATQTANSGFRRDDGWGMFTE
jgi:hypothetical protein